MKMVASAKLHKAQGAIENMLPYQKKLNKILTNFLSADLPIESPYVQEREVKRVAIVVFSSNTSLCGAFNANVIKMMIDQFYPVYISGYVHFHQAMCQFGSLLIRWFVGKRR